MTEYIYFNQYMIFLLSDKWILVQEKNQFPNILNEIKEFKRNIKYKMLVQALVNRTEKNLNYVS